MAIVDLCHEMKWGYRQYLSEPDWFLDLLQTKIQIDRKKERQRIGQMKIGHK